MRTCAAAVLLAACAAAHPHAQTPAPAGLTVVLLLDVTASMTQEALPLDQRYAQVFNAFLQGLRPSDCGAVGVIARDVRFSRVTGSHQALSTSVRNLLQTADASRLGPSPMWDAIDQALPLTIDPNGRPAVVLFSDGKSSGNVHGLDEVIAHARQLGVAVSAVVEGPGTMLLARSTAALNPADAIERLTGATGGRSLLDRPPDPRQRNPGPLVALIMDALHAGR